MLKKILKMIKLRGNFKMVDYQNDLVLFKTVEGYQNNIKMPSKI